ncbi:hypothetical protein [Nonomuraea sediminis]|uniref:hypothetical protein n=1 Tax=Nonomuraea sediminis TaxID=2835864 RepID=UPI001BDD8A1B|nr:hypothetical protein [Nonomuraea sediminis]
MAKPTTTLTVPQYIPDCSTQELDDGRVRVTYIVAGRSTVAASWRAAHIWATALGIARTWSAA